MQNAMETKQSRPRFSFSTVFHIIHVCISIGLVIAVVRNQLVNESRFEKLERNDCKSPISEETKRKNEANKSLDSITDENIIKSHDVTTVHSLAKRTSLDKQLVSGYKEELYKAAASAEPFLANQSSTTRIIEEGEGSLNDTRSSTGTTTEIPVSSTTMAKGSLKGNQENKTKPSSEPKTLKNLLSKERYLISCFKELKYFIENQFKSGEVDKNMTRGCQRLRGPKGEPGEKGKQGEKGEKGALGAKECSGTSFAYPTFEQSPRYLVFNEGDPAILSCNATANPPAQITWHRNNRVLFQKGNHVTKRYIIENRNIHIKKASARLYMCPSKIPHSVTQSTLVIKQSRGSDSGTYLCKAYNMMGAVSHEIQVLVRVYVKCSAYPSSTTVVKGNDIQLICRASGVPTPVITWYRKDGGPMPSQYNITEGDLHIYKISKEEEGTYVCLATNVLGSKTSEATITVNVIPKITSFLDKPLTLNESQTLVLPCNATGYPTPEIHWSKVNDSFPEGRYLHDSQMLNISRVKYEDRGEYVCTVNNTVGTTVNKVTVIVQAGPKIMKIPNATEYGYRGKSHTLLFEVFAFPEAKITWEKTNHKDFNEGRFQQRSGSLFIENTKYTDSGRYQATARNILGEVKVTTLLIVRDAVQALIVSKEFRKRISVKEGRNLTQMCHAVGVPTPEIVWTLKDNTTISETTLSLPLNIVNVGSQHAGRYTCTATNAFGSDQQTLNVTIIERWVKVEGRRGYYRYGYKSYSTTSRSTGTLFSYNYPSNYPGNFKYDWKLTSNSKISLYFTSFDTESCCDRLRIYNGNSTSNHLFGEFSGNALPPNITSSSNAMYLQFISDRSKQKPGFLVNYKAVD